MPLERISKGFKDISMTFQINPLNRDLIDLKNESAIARSIRNLVLTSPGERFFKPNLGSFIKKSLFESLDDITISVLTNEIRSTITLYEPRVRLDDVKIEADYDNSELNVVITYTIIGVDIPPQKLSFVLQPTR